MPRPVSWLPRLHEIRRAVARSPRSHYDRTELEHLFELQPRAAQKLLEILPTLSVGTSHLVDREVLLSFLERVQEADNTRALFKRIRAEKATASRRKPRTLVRRDVEPASLNSLPGSIGLSRGRLEVSFLSVEQLAESLYAIARLLEAEGDAFAQAFEPVLPVPSAGDAAEVEGMFAELEMMEKATGPH